MLHKSTIDFLKKLKRNNNREWFAKNKKLYEDAKYDFEVFVFELIQKIADFDESISGTQPKDCIFRIYKDVRFSKDKTPYKTNMGAFICIGGRKTSHAGYYVHISASEFFLGSGLYMPPPEQLLAVRNKIASEYKTFNKLISTPEFKKNFKELWQGDKLKTTPKGFEKDHPAAELLKLKSFIADHSYKEDKALSKGFIDYCAKMFKSTKALNDFLNAAKP
jgi:uncharacterized protein (TIGR02453 family)